MNNDRVKYHKHCRKYEQYNNRTDHCTSCKQGTDRTDHIYLRIKSYSKGCSKETASTYNNGVCYKNGTLKSPKTLLTIESFLLFPRCLCF